MGQLVLPTLGLLATHSDALAVRATNSSSSSQSTQSSTSVSITVPSSDDSSDTIDPNFPAFGFEEASFVNYALDADGNTNEFSQNLIEVVTSRTGGTPCVFRISQDNLSNIRIYAAENILGFMSLTSKYAEL